MIIQTTDYLLIDSHFVQVLFIFIWLQESLAMLVYLYYVLVLLCTMWESKGIALDAKTNLGKGTPYTKS